MKCIIIGGVAGGASTAARLRRNDENAEIILFERGEYISYANCGLPYYIGGAITERNRLFLQTPEQFNRRFNVQVRVRCEVTEIDPKLKRVSVKDLQTGAVFTETYDKLVLSPGAEPVKPPIPGIDVEGIYTVRNVPDTDCIKMHIDTKKPKRAVIVGAGFIGLEMAENLHSLGMRVTIVEMAEQVMTVLDYEMAAEVHQHLKSKNVEFYLQNGVTSFEKIGSCIAVTLKSGVIIPADIVILSIGVRPENRLAKQAGLAIGITGGIEVNGHMQTTEPDIYALGDAIEFPDPISGHKGVIPLAGPANKQARVVADNIVDGNKLSYSGTIGTAIAKVFDITVASAGLSEKILTRLDIPFQSILTHSSSHAGYYPGATPVSIKTVFHPETGKLFGGQIVGYEGVDKRIDVMASVIKAGGTVQDLMDVEHAYAPPYSSAKDPVNIAGFVADNIMNKKSRHINWREIKDNPSAYTLLDVRTPGEYALGCIDGAVNIPVDELRTRHTEVPQSKPVVVYCAVGQRAYVAERLLRQKGITNIYNLSGGYKTYSMAAQTQGNEDIFEKDFIDKDDTIYQGGR